jgi:hypothetical protein
MSNSIDARVEFSYQGKVYSPAATLDLDELMGEDGQLPDIHQILARHNAIDTYSYLYEVMQSTAIEFSNPQGMARHYFDNGRLDIEALQQGWRQHRQQQLLADIAQRHLGIDDLAQHPQLADALLDAYQQGKNAGLHEADAATPAGG